MLVLIGFYPVALKADDLFLDEVMATHDRPELDWLLAHRDHDAPVWLERTQLGDRQG